MNTYFRSQAQALESVYAEIEDAGRYEIVFPNRIWTEHVNYGHTVHYHFELIVKQTGNLAKKYLHISLYRMETGNYELNHYIA